MVRKNGGGPLDSIRTEIEAINNELHARGSKSRLWLSFIAKRWCLQVRHVEADSDTIRPISLKTVAGDVAKAKAKLLEPV